ncbi:MAG: hypothetical protein KIS80_00725 [Anaerolineales bacterium]|nr:hypothetical protein [Anaerolineales bacterium]
MKNDPLVGAGLKPAPEYIAAKTARRKSLRLPEYDYSSPGAYFFTICTYKREYSLGRVQEEKVVLSPAGEQVQQVWDELAQHYANIQFDEFVIMPNHVHGIVLILDNSEAVGAGLKPAPTTKHGLPEVVRGFKTFSARKANEIRGMSGAAFWQRGYYEHVIRNEDDLYQHQEYILSNPLKWALDEYH